MGCSKETQKALIDAGGALNPSVGNTEDDMNTLVIDLQRATQRQYLSTYKYTYNGPRSAPFDLVPGDRVTANEDFVSVAEGDTTALTNYVDNTILGAGSGLPPWFTQNFTNDLLATMTTIIQAGNSNFQYETFQRQYDDPSGNQKPISVNSIMTYANAKITTNAGTATKSVIYFIGIYYNSTGWTMVRSLQGLGGDPPNGYPIIKISIATATIMVGAALAAYILRLPAPDVPMPKIGITFNLGPANLTLGLFKWPWQRSSRDPDFKPGSMVQDAPIDAAYVEKALSNLGFSYDVMSTTSDPQMTKEIALLLIYGGAAPK